MAFGAVCGDVESRCGETGADDGIDSIADPGDRRVLPKEPDASSPLLFVVEPKSEQPGERSGVAGGLIPAPPADHIRTEPLDAAAI